MISFIRFFLLFFCFLSFSQWIEEEPLLVKKDSLSFYSFTKTGVAVFRFDDQNELLKSYADYKEPIPKSLENVDLVALSAVSDKEVVYFLYPGGGILYKFENNVIKRIDNSYAHRNQFSGHFFMYNKTLYLLGGYGYWKSKSILVKFDFKSGSWDIQPTFGSVPEKGIHKGDFVIKDNLLSVFNFFETSSEFNALNPNIFELDLNSFRWFKKGVLNASFNSDVTKAELVTRIPYKGSVFHKTPMSLIVQKVSPFLNSIELYRVEEENTIGRRSSLIIKDKLISYLINGDRIDRELVVHDLENILVFDSISPLYNDTSELLYYLVFAVFFLLFLITLILFYLKKSAPVFSVSSESVFNQDKAIAISSSEYAFLMLLISSSNNLIENSFLLESFKNNDISLDASIKRKNKMIEELDSKFFMCFSINLIEKIVDPKDSRQFIYRLNSSAKFFTKIL